MRKERDFIGTCEIPGDALYGIHSHRAAINFPDSTPFPREWYRAIGIVKLACYATYINFEEAVKTEFGQSDIELECIEQKILAVLIEAAREVSQGDHYGHFIVPAVSGGAGTSINMNINEIIANRALQKMDKTPGDYSHIDPVEHANIYQSTNDVIPTSLTVALLGLLDDLETVINRLREGMESLEKKYQHTLRTGYTQMQEAVPTSYGKLFSTYNDALSRDWWRVSKACERLKVVNLGGSAIGTGIAVPRFFIFEVVNTLREITGKPLARGENLSDATANNDRFVEVHAILKAHAVTMEKIASDLRLLSAGVTAGQGLELPARQAGSSIMPGKVNPVINEFVISACHRVYANDVLISSLAGQGCLELNAYIPSIGFALIESLKLLIAGAKTFQENMITGLRIDPGPGSREVTKSSSITTALVPYIGYNRATELAQIMKNEKVDIITANEKLGYIDPEHLKYLLEPHNLLRLGFSVREMIEENKKFEKFDSKKDDSKK
ncbi:MAG: aspartate ammonia-lyase [bacterium]|nr:aspartate ammonia-lyase [bacterium]